MAVKTLPHDPDQVGYRRIQLLVEHRRLVIIVSSLATLIIQFKICFSTAFNMQYL